LRSVLPQMSQKPVSFEIVAGSGKKKKMVAALFK
jgi:hypothetical protein